jgi:hypothetical protein
MKKNLIGYKSMNNWDRYDLGYDENIRMVHVDGYDHKDHIL